MKETYSGFNGYVDTGFHLKVTAFISVTSVYDFSGEGPVPLTTSISVFFLTLLINRRIIIGNKKVKVLFSYRNLTVIQCSVTYDDCG